MIKPIQNGDFSIQKIKIKILYRDETLMYQCSQRSMKTTMRVPCDLLKQIIFT